ncbi:MAG: biotin--[acetyl-CoA-carboxylase] ligase [Dehalococcoidia bacterium]|tara:strand:+ start:2970 stop:3716 length:747 start_codon:yes stop_codon:yes gene_type:complete
MNKIYLGKKIYIFEKVTSTMDVSKILINNQVDEGTVVISKFQTNGRGSNKREWHSEGKDALFSIILKPNKKYINLLSVLTAFSISKALEKFINTGIKIKWPNDVLVRGKKISGILIENYIKDENYSVIGIGINVNSDHSRNNSFIYPSVSLKEIIKREISTYELINEIILALETDYNDFMTGGINISEISNKLYGLNQNLTFRTNYKALDKKSKNTKYKILKLNDDGTLLVSDNKCNKLSLNASEIVI